MEEWEVYLKKKFKEEMSDGPFNVGGSKVSKEKLIKIKVSLISELGLEEEVIKEMRELKNEQ